MTMMMMAEKNNHKLCSTFLWISPKEHKRKKRWRENNRDFFFFLTSCWMSDDLCFYRLNRHGSSACYGMNRVETVNTMKNRKRSDWKTKKKNISISSPSCPLLAFLVFFLCGITWFCWLVFFLFLSGLLTFYFLYGSNSISDKPFTSPVLSSPLPVQ